LKKKKEKQPISFKKKKKILQVKAFSSTEIVRNFSLQPDTKSERLGKKNTPENTVRKTQKLTVDR
jgi:hypothetical protein